MSERLATLWQIRQGQADIILAPVSTAMTRLAPVSFLAGRTFMLSQGQTLNADALRADGTLAKLQDQLPAFSSFAAKSRIEQELGAPLSELFASFDDEPVSAASISQRPRPPRPNSGVTALTGVRNRMCSSTPKCSA